MGVRLDAPRLTSAEGRVWQTRQQTVCACRRSAHPSIGVDAKGKREPETQTCATGTRGAARREPRSGLLDIAKKDDGRAGRTQPGLCNCARTHSCLDAVRCRLSRSAQAGSTGYDAKIPVDYVTKLWYRFASSLMRASSRDDPEGGAGSGVLRPWLVTAGSGGPGHRLGTLKLQRFLAIFRRAPRRAR